MHVSTVPGAARLLLAALLVAALGCARAERLFFQAESMTAGGNNWVAVDHYGGWYSGTPSGTRMLKGSGGGQGEARTTVQVARPGVYTLWVRYLDSRYRGPFTVTVRQGDAVAATRVFDEKSLRADAAGLKKWGTGYARFVWDAMPATLAAGPAEIVLAKAPPLNVSGVARHLDCFLLTDEAGYQPKTADFVEPLYLKVKMGPGQRQPCVIHLFGRRPREPWFPPHVNFFRTRVAFGATTGYKPGGANDTFLTAGSESPWFNVAPLLDEMGTNAVQLYAIQEYNVMLPEADFSVSVSKTPGDGGLLHTFSRAGSGAGLLLNIDLAHPERVSSDREESALSAQKAKALPPVAGKRPQRFPLMTGCAVDSDFYQPASVKNEMALLAALGIDGAIGGDPAYAAAGITKMRPGIGVFSLRNNDCMNDPKTADIRARVRETMQGLLDKGLGKDIVSWKLMDEPGSMPFEHIVACPKCAAAFHAYLKGRGLQPADFGKAEWAEIAPVSAPAAGAALYYHSVNFRCQALADFFKVATDAAREVDPQVRTQANFAEDLTFNGNGLKSGVDWFLIFASGGLTSGWTEDWLSYSTTYQFNGYRADYLRAATRGGFFGIYNILRSAWDTQAKTAAAIGHGAGAIFYYNYGPKYAAVVDSHSERPEALAAMRRANYAVGAVEDYLVGARVPASRIGLLHTRTTDLWTLDAANSTFGKERMGLYLLLRHLGYPVDILTEDDAAAKKLGNYLAVFVAGSHLRRDAADGLLLWAKDGGRLFCDAGSLAFDEYNRPLGLDAALGLARAPYTEQENVGRELYEVPNLKNLAPVTYGKETLESLCGVQRLTAVPADARVPATFADGSPAVLARPLGKGQLLFSGAFPGIAYLKSGVLAAKAEKTRLEEAKQTPVTYNPPAYNAAYRALLADLLAGLAWRPTVSTGNPLVEANLLEGEKGCVIALSNWTGKPVKGLTVTIAPGRKTGKPFAALATLAAKPAPAGSVALTLDLQEADYIVLPYAGK